MAGIYIHIPFCRQKCFYCNFYSINSLQHKEAIENAIITELSLRSSFLKGENIETIYFGGGTPTLMGIRALAHIIDAVYQHYHVAEKPEITIEANPDDLSLDFSNELHHLCNRLSIGIQSFNDDELKYLGRQHDSQTAQKAIENVRLAGFDNISLDLIYGINNHLSLFQNSVETVLTFHPEHLSAYVLTCEPNTIFDRLVAQKKRALPSEELIIEQYNYLTDKLKENGFQHYEISNFSQPNHASLHNSNYWKGMPYLGVGPAAHSFSGEIRQWNTASIEKYLEAMKNGIGVREEERLTELMQYEEFVMLRLRTEKGISLSEMTKKFGEETVQKWREKAQKYVVAGEMIIQNDSYRIAESSLLISDSIIADLV